MVNLSSGTLSSPTTTISSGASLLLAGGTMLPTASLIDNGMVNLSVSSSLGILSGNGTVNLNENVLTAPVGGAFGGVIQDGSGSGGVNVPSGTLALTGGNTYTGATTISGTGTLQLGNGGTTGTLNPASSISDAGFLAFNNSSSLTVNNTITGAGQILQNGAGTVLLGGTLSGFTGAYNLAAGTLVFNFNSANIANPILNHGPATIQNVGKLILSGTQTLSASSLTYNVSPFAGTLSDGVAADVELTGSVNESGGSGIVLTGTGVLALSGSTDNATLGANVSGGTLLLNKASSPTVHSIGGGGLTINSGGTAILTGTGGDQIYNIANAGGTLNVKDGGLFEMNGESQGVYNFTLGSSTTGSGGTLSDNVPNSDSVLTVGGTTTGTFSVKGNGNIYAESGANLELTVNGSAAGSGATQILTTNDPSLRITFTLPVDPHGISQAARGLLTDAVAKGVSVYSANIMTMFFGQHFIHKGKSEGQLGIESALQAHEQIRQINPDIQIGLCPCLGENGSRPSFSRWMMPEYYGISPIKHRGFVRCISGRSTMTQAITRAVPPPNRRSTPSHGTLPRSSQASPHGARHTPI